MREVIFFAAPDDIDYSICPPGSSAAVILTQDGRLCMQRRPLDAKRFPGRLSIFGGMCEASEDLTTTLLRELREEIEADPQRDEIVFLGAHAFSHPQDDGTFAPMMVHGRYFWHDVRGTIGQCHEGSIEIYDRAGDVLLQDNLHPSVTWCLEECLKRGLIE